MRFNFDEDHLMFQRSVRDFLAAQCTPESMRTLWDDDSGRSSERWAKLAELGLLGILVPAEHGGLGMGEVDFVLPLEETGRAALPEAIVETAAVAAPLIAEAGDAELAARWLPLIASGDAVVAVGHPINPTVADAHVADLLLLPGGPTFGIYHDDFHASHALLAPPVTFVAVAGWCAVTAGCWRWVGRDR